MKWKAQVVKEWTDEATGLSCVITRHQRLGILCGYVAIGKDHKLYGCTGDDLCVHGGVTFEGGDDGGLWWFGFDCGHAFDGIPGMPGNENDGPVRDVEFATADCEKLAKQLADREHAG